MSSIKYYHNKIIQQFILSLIILIVTASKAPLKAIIIAIVTITMRQLCGVFPIINYASSVFGETGSNLSKNTSSIILGCIQVSGSLLAAILIERTGRKVLYLISSAGASICLFISGVYVYLKDEVDMTNFQWIPLLSVSGVVIFSACGLLSLPFVLMVETCSQKVSLIYYLYQIFNFTFYFSDSWCVNNMG